MKRVFGIIGPQPYMQTALEGLSKEFVIHNLEPKSWEPAEIAEIVAFCKANGIESVGGFAQKDAFHHVLINAGLGNLTPSRLSILYGMNKYLMRTLEVEPFFFAPVDPITETDEQIKAKIPDNEWPFMLKNTSLSLGRGVYKIRNYEQLKEVLRSYRENKDLQEMIAFQNRSILAGVDPAIVPPVVPPFIAEHMESDDSIEYCHEGFVTPEGKIVHYGFTEEVYFANHQGLGYVTPPVSVDASIASKIEAWVDAYMAGFVKVGYLNQFFNLEFWIRKDGGIKLTELNPRTAHSFHFNYALCCGANLYRDDLLLAAGDQVPTPTPFMLWKAGRKTKYTMIALITLTEVGKISDLVDYNYVEQLKQSILVRLTKKPDEVIEAGDLTSAGVMVMQLWITGDTKEELVAKEAEIRSKIYKKEQEFNYPSYWK